MSSRTGDQPTHTRLPREKRREQFLDVAAKLILEGGVDSVTMEGVAAAAGVSKGLGYAYFANRGELLLALLNRESRSLERRAAQGIAEASDYEGKVRASVRAWMDAIAERGVLLAALLRETQDHQPYNERRNNYYRTLEEFWGDMAAREFDIPKKKAVAAAAIMIAGLSGLLERWIQARDSRKMLEDVYVKMSIGALNALRDAP
ncbi:MAG TPA: TetR/AcrR family transcriptional regulator [Acidimicrobiales bacterium]|nr:TetR/AcrR family transcriptional regulator [Acidimicrobiales bacterium]